MCQCVNSFKCISRYRLMDTLSDCPNEDDKNLKHITAVGLIELLKKHIKFCQINNNLTCQHGGQCIPVDEYMSSSNKKFSCICPKGYSGDRCEIVDNKIILSFENDIVLSQSIFIHFIEAINGSVPMRMTTFRTIFPVKNSLTILWSRSFHLIFIELYNKNYYLVVIQKIYEQSTTIIKKIKSSDRCQHINELFNEIFVKLHLTRRIKYYHLSCQQNLSNLPCFYDDVHICLCYDHRKQRLANCFEFNYNMKSDCLGQSVCENVGQCFQDTEVLRCQFSSNRFGLSLDAILGYHIQPNISLLNQLNIVKISLALTVIFLVAGFINGVLSSITFNNKQICEVGCDVLKQQIQQYKHLLTASVLLVILGLPRLIILFVSKCMKSTNDGWLFLVGYFISFIPPMLTFVVFILPSKFYKE
ncbi:unnamed protein product [Rotaria sp. Silwood2]|nr:unnamed protein product [Rotaria sp. Silwood2]